MDARLQVGHARTGRSPPPRRRRATRAALRAVVGASALAAGVASSQVDNPTSGLPGLPEAVAAALARAGLPAGALAAVVEPLDALPARRRFAWRAEASVNPASVMKLVTTFAALDLLGPAWTWSTPVWLAGPIHDGTLDGDLVIRGSGDPQLVQERLWAMLRRLQGLGVNTIQGDIVLDRSAFPGPADDPAAFDDEPLRPYNVGADALLLNYRALTFTFVPDPARGVARILVDPPLAGVRVGGRLAPSAARQTPVELAPTVPLARGGACGAWRDTLGANFSDPSWLRFEGRYPAACGERNWPIAYPDPAGYDARLLRGLWAGMGGSLTGRVRNGPSPATPPSFVLRSPPLAAVVRDLNKFSNNLMAQQLFLTLALQRGGAGTPDAARQLLVRWAVSRLGADAAAGLVVDNGSGLSRRGRVSARLVARLLQVAWASPVMAELLASLPVDGVDGTLARNDAAEPADVGAPSGRRSAHLKTGSLRDVAALAGVVLADSGRRYLLVAILDHPDANGPAARSVLQAVVRWTQSDLEVQPTTADLPALPSGS